MLDTVGKSESDETVYALSEGVEPMYLTSSGKEGEQDPHAWLNIVNGIRYAENAQKVLIAKDPANKESYQTNGDRYIAKLQKLHEDAVTGLPISLKKSHSRYQ
ncbi:Metal ABC transporter substrate-binding lipoprotein precursor [compost metagenome]